MSDPSRTRHPFSLMAVGAAVSCAFAALLAGLGNRLGWWDFRTGIMILKWAVYAEGIVVAVSIIGLIAAAFKRRKRTAAYLMIGSVISALAIGIPLSVYITAHHLPPIHDITTDMENPPRFDAILKLRRDAPNTSEYGGARIAAIQRKAYPDIVPLILDVPPAKAFDLAAAAAAKMGWQIVNADAATGIIEATDTTFWFGFKDDVVIRVSADAKGSRIDVRSVSRVGVSDIGTNAGRIRNYLRVLKETR